MADWHWEDFLRSAITAAKRTGLDVIVASLEEALKKGDCDAAHVASLTSSAYYLEGAVDAFMACGDKERAMEANVALGRVWDAVDAMTGKAEEDDEG